MSNMTNWSNDAIQFPRLIAELEAAGAFTRSVMDSLCESMDLERRDVCELMERAQRQWDDIKANTVAGVDVTKATAEMVNLFTDGTIGDDIATHFTCTECEVVCEFLEAHGETEAAQTFREFHARGDEQGDSEAHLELKHKLEDEGIK